MNCIRSIAAYWFAPLQLWMIASAAAQEPQKPFPQNATEILENYCYSCHDEDMQKGNIQLDNLADLETPKRLELLNRMQEQIYFQYMPPKQKRQPYEEERKSILGFISADLGVHGASTLEGKLQKPEYGNYINHEKRFSGEYKDVPAYTTDRRWLISEFIFNAKFQRILGNDHTGVALWLDQQGQRGMGVFLAAKHRGLRLAFNAFSGLQRACGWGYPGERPVFILVVAV